MTTTENTYPHELAGEEAEAPVQPTPEEVEAGREITRGLRALVAVPHEEVRTAGYRIAGCLDQGRAEANAASPGRDRASDGWLGDQAHAARVSDHNPDGHGIVCALDLDVDGLNLPDAMERLRQKVLAGQAPWLVDGYLILNRRITAPDFRSWRAYSGPNPHTSHGHVSCTHALDRVDRRDAWGVFAPPPSAPAHPPVLAWPLGRTRSGRTEYVGDRKGAAESIGAAYNPATRRWDAPHPFVRNVQQWLIFRGCVPGVAAAAWSTSGWADGRFDAPYSTQAARTWHERFYPHQPRPEEIWADDYAILTRL